MSPLETKQKGFSLVETMIGLSVMAVVITAGLIALGQTTLLSEKSSEQILADFALRTEVESLRSSSWSAVEAQHNTIKDHISQTSDKSYPVLMNFDKKSLADMGLTAEVTSTQLNSSGETGKLAFKVLVS